MGGKGSKGRLIDIVVIDRVGLPCLLLHILHVLHGYIFARMSGMLDLSNEANAKHLFPILPNVANVVMLPVPMLPVTTSSTHLFLCRSYTC